MENKNGFCDKYLRFVDFLSELAGKISGWLLVLLIFLLVYEVVMRKIFSHPSSWNYDVSYMVGGSAILLGGAMALKNRRHVRVDVIYALLSPKKQTILNIVLAILFFFPLIFFGTNKIMGMTLKSWAIKEKVMVGMTTVPIYPMKTALLISMILLLLQGTAEFIRELKNLKKLKSQQENMPIR
jgi:TRAP-type mannitol/chloroaromatic compound transport system permease small subunit